MLRRIRTVLNKGTQNNGRRSEIALGALELLIRLADKAQIPLIGGGFGLVVELIQTFQVNKSNQAGFDVLLQSVSSHSEVIWQFVQAMTPEYLKNSEEARAQMARGAIIAFGRELDKIRALVIGHSHLGLSQRGILAASIQADIQASNARLQEARAQFTVKPIPLKELGSIHSIRQNAQLNILIAGKYPSLGGDDLCITGATPVLGSDLDVSSLQSVPPPGPYGGCIQMFTLIIPVNESSLYQDVMFARIKSRRKLIKLYHKSAGGRSAFDRDIAWLAQNIHPNLPNIEAYCRSSSVPFIVFSLTPIINFADQFCYFMCQERAITDALNFLPEILSVIIFLAANSNSPLPMHGLKALLLNAKLDDNNKLVFFPYASLLEGRPVQGCPVWTPPYLSFGGTWPWRGPLPTRCRKNHAQVPNTKLSFFWLSARFQARPPTQLASHRWTFLATRIEDPRLDWDIWCEFCIFPGLRGPPIPEYGQPRNAWWSKDKSYKCGDLGVFDPQDGSPWVTFRHLGSTLDHPETFANGGPHEAGHRSWKRVDATWGGNYSGMQPELPQPCLDKRIGTINVLGLPLQSAHNTPDEDENTNLGGLVTYSTFGFRQTLSWAVLESYRSQGWKLATQYGVPTEKLALIAVPANIWSVRLPDPSVFHQYLTDEQQGQLRVYLFADDLECKPYARWSLSEDPFDEAGTSATGLLLKENGPPVLEEYFSFSDHVIWHPNAYQPEPPGDTPLTEHKS